MKYPEYLQHDINELLAAYDRNDPYWDKYWDELYGSINMAWSDGSITIDEASDLRKRFLNI